MIELVVAGCVFAVMFGALGTAQVVRNRAAGRGDGDGVAQLAAQLGVVYVVIGAVLALASTASSPGEARESPNAGVEAPDAMVGP